MEISEAPSSIAGDHPPSTKKIEHRKTMSTRRFSPPWSVEELDACFVVTDSAGWKLSYVYFEDDRVKCMAGLTAPRSHHGDAPKQRL